MTTTTIEKPAVETPEPGPGTSDFPPTDEEAKPEAADGKALFDASDYDREDLAIQKIDGNQIDRIAITFTGTVYLDRSSPQDVALFNRARLFQDITLMVEGKCSGTGAKGATDREGELDVIIGQRTVKVTTVYVPAIDE